MNIIFMGTPDFSVPTLQMLIDEGHNVLAVVTQPDRPKGRGNKVLMPPVKELALKYDLPVLQPERVKGNEEFLNHIKTLNPDVMVVVAYGQILPESVLEVPSLGCINIHGSLLPKYRGAAPIQWSILDEEKETGVTIMYMDKGMDTGDMLYKKSMPIDPSDTYESLHDKMKIVGAQALKEAMPMIEAGGKEREKQDDNQATYASMIQKALGEINWEKSNHEIDAKVRGLNPWPVAYTYYEGQPMKVWQTSMTNENTDYAPGTIIEVDKAGMHVQTGNGILIIEEIQAPNKKRMPVSEYIKGNSIEKGRLLGN
ncbi:methionyl-tRNA formyltransferase [Niameybacter massiliensis]|uniref:Methionyl-tRNA formyltransferase n=1 Tax=Holtiella tumoricola TaxID=3018743 RepID=A0AA42DQI3_9FIRM|nr:MULTISPECIES: methionyl-tRNA formyltransferase [Lachnospirales]MDA3733104.1 methionyl-tRNA formyltransferase [Holtiella tumoricola]